MPCHWTYRMIFPPRYPGIYFGWKNQHREIFRPRLGFLPGNRPVLKSTLQTAKLTCECRPALPKMPSSVVGICRDCAMSAFMYWWCCSVRHPVNVRGIQLMNIVAFEFILYITTELNLVYAHGLKVILFNFIYYLLNSVFWPNINFITQRPVCI